MFKKIKESEVYNKYKELKSNPQTSALVSLGVWLFIFIIIIIFVRGINTNSVSNEKRVTDYRLSNYEYTYQNDNKTIFGKYYNGKQVFNILNNKYYYDKENVYIVKENTLEVVSDFDMNILKITPDFIDELISNLNFTEGENFKQYLVPLGNFMNLYEVDTAVDLSVVSDYNIIVQKYFDGDSLYKIEVDLSNYYKINNLNDDGKLIISIYNKNQLNDFTLEYDKMLGVN